MAGPMHSIYLLHLLLEQAFLERAHPAWSNDKKPTLVGAAAHRNYLENLIFMFIVDFDLFFPTYIEFAIFCAVLHYFTMVSASKHLMVEYMQKVIEPAINSTGVQNGVIKDQVAASRGQQVEHVPHDSSPGHNDTRCEHILLGSARHQPTC